MLRWLTAGESHGPALMATIEGLPAGVQVTSSDVAAALARRRLGFGRGARMKFELDEVEFLGGLRHGVTLGSPLAIRIGNTEWPKWQTVMSPDPVAADALAAADDVGAPSAPRSCPTTARRRPAGHARAARTSSSRRLSGRTTPANSTTRSSGPAVHSARQRAIRSGVGAGTSCTSGESVACVPRLRSVATSICE